MIKQKKLLPKFLYRVKGPFIKFLTGRMVGGGRPLLPEILGQADPITSEILIFNLYPLIVPWPEILEKKSSVVTDRKSTMGFAVSLR